MIVSLVIYAVNVIKQHKSLLKNTSSNFHQCFLGIFQKVFKPFNNIFYSFVHCFSLLWNDNIYCLLNFLSENNKIMWSYNMLRAINLHTFQKIICLWMKDLSMLFHVWLKTHWKHLIKFYNTYMHAVFMEFSSTMVQK